MAVVSNKVDSAVKPLCETFFPGVYALGEIPGCPRKPAPDMVFSALKQLDLTPSDAYYVGDSEVDILTAKNAGLPCLAVTWGFRSEAFLVSNGATALIRDPSELVEIMIG